MSTPRLEVRNLSVTFAGVTVLENAHLQLMPGEVHALVGVQFQIAAEVFSGLQGFDLPEGGFFLWLPVGDGEEAALKLWQQVGVRVLPGAYLSREVGGQNPGKGYIRVALVAPAEETRRGLIRLRDCVYG